MEYEYKVYRFVTEYETANRHICALEKLLNDGWQIERADHTGNNTVIMYILKRKL